jgi:hypothetical protein
MRLSVAFERLWVCVRRTLRRSSCSVNLHGGFDESPSYWCLIRPPSSWEPMVISCHHFRDICDCAFWEVGHPLLWSFWISSPWFDIFRNWARYTHLTAKRSMFQFVHASKAFHRVPSSLSCSDVFKILYHADHCNRSSDWSKERT